MTRAFRKIIARVIPAKAGIQFFILILSLGLSASVGAEDKDKKPIRPPTKQTQALRPETYKKLEAVQKQMDAKDYIGALASLDQLKANSAKLNDFEKATLYNLYAFVHFSQNNIPKALEAYQTVLKQDKLPDGLRNATLYALAQMYFIQENYDQAIATLKAWFQATGSEQPDGHTLIAQAHYQRQDFKGAEKSALTALRLTKQQNLTPKESLLALLRAVYYEMKDYKKSATVLEALLTYYPGKGTYWSQLAGMYGLLDRQKDQLRILHAAYVNNLLTAEGDLLNLARLYMLEEAPYPAVLVLQKALKDKTIKDNSGNLQLLAQALSLAREYEQQIPVLQELAKSTGEAKHYVFLGQAQGELNQWKEAVESFKAALKAKDVAKPATIRMQLGTALFNAGRLNEAREVFVAAAESEGLEQQAGNWIKFVSSEIHKREALRSAGS